MIAVAFILFAVLVVAWLLAPNGERAIQPAPAPAMPDVQMSGSPAD